MTSTSTPARLGNGLDLLVERRGFLGAGVKFNNTPRPSFLIPPVDNSRHGTPHCGTPATAPCGQGAMPGAVRAPGKGANMNENVFISVEIRRLIGEPIITPVGEFDNVNYDRETREAYAEVYGFEPHEVEAFIAEYLNWCEVLVLRSRATGKDVCAALILSNGEWLTGSLESIEPDLTHALINYTCLTFG